MSISSSAGGDNVARYSRPICDSYCCDGNTIGSGTYGRVSIVTGISATGRELYALKECTQDSSFPGIFGIMEPVILMSLRHPYLVCGVEAKVDSVSGYYVQEIGKRNLMQARRNEVFDSNKKKKYCHQLAQAVKVLHRLNIVHGDIKSANVVMYPDDTLRLIDFSLSFITRENEEYYSEMCTANYRPPEIVLKKAWCKSIDIWCLACVFYEIYYGKQLFRGQRGDVEQNEALSRAQMTNALADWNDILTKNFSRKPYILPRQTIDYKEPVLTEEFWYEENKVFNDLLVNMLEMREDERYDISMVLEHEYFHGEKTYNAQCLRPPIRDIDAMEEKRCRRHIEVHCLPEFTSFVYDLYRRCDAPGVEGEEIMIKACTLIIYKLYRIAPSKCDEEVYRVEREIANSRHFHLLPLYSS